MDDVQSLLPFVPRLAVQRLLPPGGGSWEPREQRLSAAMLFVDIAGYTALVERLRGEGSRGAERTQEILNRVFGPITSLIEDAGGEVLRFPGDAALALFPGDGSTDTTVPVRRASAAAQNAIHRLNEKPVQDGVLLRLRVAIGAGPVWIAALGGVGGRFELLVRGGAVDQLSGALALARPGEIVLSAEAAGLAGDAVQGEPRGTALCLQSVEPVPPPQPTDRGEPHADQLEALVPRSVRARLAAGQREFLAELRRVTVVFVHLRDFDAGATDAHPRLQAAFVAVQEVVAHYGGSINQVVDDGKGTVFLIGFGVALHAHEDDGLRAVSAALAMREQLVEQELDPRIGITSDLAFTGWRGGERRAEFALIGSAVNLAARLMMQADPILCDANTRLAVGRKVLFESLAPIWLKGLSEAVRVYRPRSARVDKDASSLLGPQSSLVGRDRERQILERHLAELDSGAKGGAVLVEGEPGVGKSSLVRHLIAVAQRTSVRTMVGAGDATEGKTPMLAWKPVVNTLLGSFVTLDQVTVIERLNDLLGRERADTFPVLDPVLPVRLPSTSLSRHISPQGRAEMIRDLLRRLLTATTTRGPVLLVLDDGHWMDSASWEFVEVAREVPGLLLVVSMRPMTERPPPCQRLIDDSGTKVVRLDVIGSAETVALACQLLDVDTLPEELAHFIHRRAEGHPLFIEQLTHALRESGCLEIAAHECRLLGTPEDLDQLKVPETVSGLVRSRIDALEPEQQLTLKVAAVLGRHFELDGLTAVHPLTDDPLVLSRHIQTMAAFGLLKSPQDGSADWEFRHALIREAAYELLPFAQRSELHLETARWLERQFVHQPEEVHATLGHHYEQAGDHETAISHLTAAGDHALQLWENTEVVHFFERVIRLDLARGPAGARDEVVLASWERKMGEALCNLGELDRGVPLLRSALRRLGLHVPKRQAFLVIGLLLRLLRLVARVPRPPISRVNGVREARAVRETISAVLPLGAAAYSRGTILESIYLTLRALDVARRLGPSATLADVYVGISNIAAMAHRLRIARAYAAQGADMAAREGDLAALGASLCVGQLFEVAVANFDAVESIERGSAILARIGETHRWHSGALMVAQFQLMKGDLESSMECAQDVLASAREVNAVVQEHWSLAAIADCQLRLGRLDDAIRTAQEILERSHKSGTEDHIAPFRAAGVLASAWLRRHGAAPPEEVLKRGEAAMSHGGWQSFSPGSDFVGLAEARLAALAAGEGDREEHLCGLRSMARTLRRTVFLRPVARSTLLWLHSEIDWHSGRTRRAERKLRQAIESADGYRLPFEGARLRVGLARKLRPNHREFQHLLSTAAEGFASIGASWELAEARRLKG